VAGGGGEASANGISVKRSVNHQRNGVVAIGISLNISVAAASIIKQYKAKSRKRSGSESGKTAAASEIENIKAK